MNWLTILWLVAIAIALVAVVGIKPKGTRHVSHTRLMTAARVVLGIFLVCLALVALDVF
jgi:hypothetical protein